MANPLDRSSPIDAATERELLLTEIARCPLAEYNLMVEQPSHPCREVVVHQWPDAPTEARWGKRRRKDWPDLPLEARRSRWQREHHMPEPWLGHIEKAPLLFVSSNPSLSSYRERNPATQFARPLTRIGDHRVHDHPAIRHGLAAPKRWWRDKAIIDRYSNAFDVWISGGVAGVADETGRPGEAVRYWSRVRDLAERFFNDKNVRPGLDYAITEVVHCKSRGETGVGSAVAVCAPLYLRRVIALSPARLVVVLGDHARNAVRNVFHYPDPGRISRSLRIGGRGRAFVFLGHPTARRTRPEYPRKLPDDELVEARKWLAKVARPN